MIEEGQEEIRRRRGSRRKPGERHTRLKPMKSVDREVKPQPELHARIKDKIKKSAEDRKQEIQPYPRPKGSEQQEERHPAQPPDAREPQKQEEAEELQSLTRKNFKEMLKRKVDEQAAQAAKRRRTFEVKAVKQVQQSAKQDQTNSREGQLQDIRKEGSECNEDQLQVQLIKEDTVFNATYDHDPQLPGIKGQTEAMYGRLWAREDTVFNATYDHDPQLPGLKGKTEAIRKRLWSESRGYEAEAGAHRDDKRTSQDDGEGPTVKKLNKSETKKVQVRTRMDTKSEMDAIARIARAKNG